MVRIPKRLHGLDALRGIAALTVVTWHWRHFAPLLSSNGRVAPAAYPFHWLLWPFYNNAWMAPDLFFVLSGFVFMWLYAGKVASGVVGGWDFFSRRFARLYPLHILTLIFVAIGQWCYFRFAHTSFEHQGNDANHFILNLFMAQDWVQSAESFNGPTWSISIEVLLYGMFFLLARSRALLSAVTPFALLAIGIPLIPIQSGWSDLGRGISGFFAGCICFRIYQLALVNPRVRLLVFAASVFAVYQIAMPGSSILMVSLLGFPLLVINLALIETFAPRVFARAGWLGELSYSSYLLHFPLQLMAATAVVAGVFPAATLFSRSFFLEFYAALILLSLLSFHFVERPSQAFLLRRLKPQPSAALAPNLPG